ncbi:MAG: hypothetical protein KAR20_12545 [Candidatus Heimdallarchaeota archaeon]|nr:hypothetical protein [Candidatus Heimdallarchaeota archaeon]
MGCITVRNPSGINPDCVQYIEAAENVIIFAAGVDFATVGAFQSLESHRVLIQESLTEYIPLGIKGYESTPGTLNKETSDFDGSSVVTFEGPPSIIMDIQSNPCDWNELMAQLTGEGFRIGFVMKKTGDVMVAVLADGSVKGFLANAFASSPTLRPQGESFQSYKLSLDFQNVQEFRQFNLISMPFNPTVELPTRMPIGLTMKQAGAYAVSDVNVTVFERCAGAYAGTPTVEEIESYDSVTGLPIDSFSSSVVNNTGGSYTLTLEKDSTPVTLVAGDWVIIKVATKTGSVFDYVSGELLISV